MDKFNESGEELFDVLKPIIYVEDIKDSYLIKDTGKEDELFETYESFMEAKGHEIEAVEESYLRAAHHAIKRKEALIERE